MSYPYSKYRIVVGQILFGFYVLGAFQAPVLELLHLISHSISNHEHGGLHSYADHGISQHHALLQVLENGGEDDNNEQHTILKSVDKNECLSESLFTLEIIKKSSSLQIEIAQKASCLKLDIPSPPPE